MIEHHTNAHRDSGLTYLLKFRDGDTLRRNYEQLKLAKVEYEGPISGTDCPVAVPPYILTHHPRRTPPAPLTLVSPIAHQTRQRTARNATHARIANRLTPMPTT